MIEIRRTEAFSDWLRGLKDRRARAKIALRIDRLALGNPGDVAPVGEGVASCASTSGRDTAFTSCSGAED
jgi:putative addiction module killer protein